MHVAAELQLVGIWEDMLTKSDLGWDRVWYALGG